MARTARGDPRVRGTSAVLPVPAPRSTLADGLRHVAADRSSHHRLLPLDAAAADSPLRSRTPDARLSGATTERDDGTRPLSDKLLARPAALARILRAISEPARAYLLAHNSTALERDLALTLDIPIYGPDPAHRGLGTKSGSRELFALSGVPLPAWRPLRSRPWESQHARPGSRPITQPRASATPAHAELQYPSADTALISNASEHARASSPTPPPKDAPPQFRKRPSTTAPLAARLGFSSEMRSAVAIDLSG